MAEKKEKRYVSDNAQLMAEWEWEKNSELGFYPNLLTHQSNKKVWWRCSEGHEWEAAINNRSNGRKCPYCSGRRVLDGYNDLKTINPAVAAEWNYDRNTNSRPEEFTVNSNKRVWWKCQKGHEWQTTIAHRTAGNRCPVCFSERHTSFPEYALVYYLKKHGIEVIHSYREQGFELDVYIPSQKTAIEYDGYFWHKGKIKQDLNKNKKCKEAGIRLYRIREGLPSLDDSSIDYTIQRTQSDLPQTLSEILNIVTGTTIEVDIKRDTIAIENLREYTEKEKSVLILTPEIASEWNYEKNGSLTPEKFSASSNKKVWWKCRNGHEWQATINHRNVGTGCPYCSNKKVLNGYNDLQTINPDLAMEWHYEKNGVLTPENFIANSNKKVWWKCKEGHEWKTDIAHRNNGRGCPYCAGRKVFYGGNDLQTINPGLASEWNYERNGSLHPADFTANSGKKVWWKCKNGHEWQATIDSRNGGTGCPYCSSRKTLKGYNDLQAANPMLAKEWNFDKNGVLRPENFTANSHKKVWWKCSEGHEWQATIGNRNLGRGCPYCSGKKVLEGYNDLSTINQNLAKEWHYEKNGILKPEDFTANSGEKVWWKCSAGHEWVATIKDRNRGNGCPICAREKRKNVK